MTPPPGSDTKVAEAPIEQSAVRERFWEGFLLRISVLYLACKRF